MSQEALIPSATTTMTTSTAPTTPISSTANEQFNLYLKFYTRLPPPDNVSSWIVVTSRWPDHLFLLRNWLREKGFTDKLYAKSKRLIQLDIQGEFTDNASILHVNPLWDTSKRTKPSIHSRTAILSVVENQLNKYKRKFKKDKIHRHPILSHSLCYIEDEDQDQSETAMRNKANFDNLVLEMASLRSQN